MKENILIVDDSKTICKTLEKLIKEQLDYNTIIFNSKRECELFLSTTNLKISVALLDLGLPDAPYGEIVDMVSNNYDIPVIVLTGSKDKENIFRNKNIVDYVIKDGKFSFEYAINLINRIVKNNNVKIIIASKDLEQSNNQIKLLKNYKLESIFCTNSNKILESLKNNENIKLVFLDENIDDVSMVKLISAIRMNYSMDTMRIISICSFEKRSNSAELLKYGVDDIIYKGFSNEEFHAKLLVNLETLDLFQNIKDKANKDFLTGAYNRRYFFNEGYLKFKQKENAKLFMVDIDKFKNINDTYGHDIGDLAIKEVIRVLNVLLADIDCILSRFGGEEFCAIVFDLEEKEFISLLEKIRKTFEHNILKVNDLEINYTVSIGYTMNKVDNLDNMIIAADKGLYKAKNSGRNQVRS